MAAHPECHICCVESSKSTGCPFCGAVICTTCLKRYLLETPELPHCPNCKKFLSNTFLRRTITKVFVDKELKKHRQSILFEIQKTLLPGSAVKAEKIAELNVAIIPEDTLKPLREEMTELKVKLFALQKRYNEAYSTNTQIKSAIGGILRGTTEGGIGDGIWKCPADGCPGYIMRNWKCGTCELQICARCRLPFVKGHLCKQEDVDSIKMISEETKPCPNCKARISRISGCDQMWCTACHTRFDWRTGRPTHGGFFHNPHEAAWRQSHHDPARPPVDTVCSNQAETLTYLATKTKNHVLVATAAQLVNIENAVGHLRTQITAAESESAEEEDRIKYLNKVITAEEFLSKLFTHDKQLLAKKYVVEILVTIPVILGDLIRRVIADPIQQDSVLTELEQFRTFTNEALTNVREDLGLVAPLIDESWRFVGTTYGGRRMVKVTD